jgi:hypothetical protein
MRRAGRPINPNAVTGFEVLHNSDTRDQALIDLGQWAIDTCLLFGCCPETAWEVAAIFIRGLRKELGGKK